MSPLIYSPIILTEAVDAAVRPVCAPTPADHRPTHHQAAKVVAETVDNWCSRRRVQIAGRFVGRQCQAQQDGSPESMHGHVDAESRATFVGATTWDSTMSLPHAYLTSLKNTSAMLITVEAAQAPPHLFLPPVPRRRHAAPLTGQRQNRHVGQRDHKRRLLLASAAATPASAELSGASPSRSGPRATLFQG